MDDYRDLAAFGDECVEPTVPSNEILVEFGRRKGRLLRGHYDMPRFLPSS